MNFQYEFDALEVMSYGQHLLGSVICVESLYRDSQRGFGNNRSSLVKTKTRQI